MKKKVVAIVGPTAVGKTALSIEIAKRFNGEIISGDSMQVYRGMNIGTAKVKENEKQNIPHYMIDIKEPNDSFTVVDFQLSVQQYIENITNRDKLPILVGGSGLYIQAALYDYNFSQQPKDTEYVKQLEKEIENNGIDKLYDYLKKIDREQAEKIHPNNHRRVMRALEIYKTTGLTMTEYQEEQPKNSPYNIIFIGLEMERQLLYDRINLRVDKMIEEGLISEVSSLLKEYSEDCQSMQAIGYKEFSPYFRNEYSLDDAIELLKRNSRRYAKRQYTWFKNKLEIDWYLIEPKLINYNIENIIINLTEVLRKNQN